MQRGLCKRCHLKCVGEKRGATKSRKGGIITISVTRSPRKVWPWEAAQSHPEGPADWRLNWPHSLHLAPCPSYRSEEDSCRVWTLLSLDLLLHTEFGVWSAQILVGCFSSQEETEGSCWSKLFTFSYRFGGHSSVVSSACINCASSLSPVHLFCHKE